MRKERKSHRSLLYKLCEVGLWKVYIHEKGHPWPGQELGLHITTLNLCDGVETVNEFCYLGDKLITSGGCEGAVTARMRIGWIKFRECRELLLGKRFSLKIIIKAIVFQSCVWSAMPYGSESWCLREKETGILRRT